MADFGDYVTPRDLELAADRARRIRALAASAIACAVAINDEPLTDLELSMCCRAALPECARIIDALEAARDARADLPSCEFLASSGEGSVIVGRATLLRLLDALDGKVVKG